MILTREGTYCPSSGELYDFDMRRHVLSIICGAIWFWHEKARTVHHLWSYLILNWEARTLHILPSYMILTWDGPYRQSFGELYHFDLRRHVMSIIWGALWFWHEKTRTVYHLGSSDFDMRRHVLPINWGDLRFWHEKTRTVHHLGNSMILTWEGT